MHFQIIALTILAVFYGCYFGKMLAQKKRGIRTDHLGQGKEGFVKAVEIGTKFSSIVIVIIEISSILTGACAFPDPVRWAGALAAAAGTVIFIASILTMRDSWRAGVSTTEKTELITGGIYRFSRNPAFLGFDLVYLGIALMFANPLLLIASFITALIFHLQIVNVEEDFLLEAFGEEYLRYKKTVNRYFGRRA